MMEIKPGKYHIDYSKGGRDAIKKTTIHVRGEIDGHLVCREWIKAARSWFYWVDKKENLAFMIKNGIMTKGSK